MRTLAEIGYVCKGYYLDDRRHPSYPEEYDWPHDLGLRVPDFNCPVTRQSVLHLVRQDWKDDRIHVYPVQGEADNIVGWNVGVFPWKLCGTGPTELEALVCALEAAPQK